MKFWQYVLIGIAVLIGANIVIGLVTGLLALVFKIAIPVLVIGGIGFVAYKYVTRDKALSGDSRRSLP